MVIAIAVLVLAIAVATQLQIIFAAFLSTYTGQRLVLSFRKLLFAHTQRLSLAYHDTKGTADSTYRIQYDAESIDAIANDAVFPFVTSLVTLVTMIYITMRIDWQLAAIGLTIAPLLLLCSYF